VPVLFVLFLGERPTIFLEYFLVDAIIVILINYQFLKVSDYDLLFGFNPFRKSIIITIYGLIIALNIYILFDPEIDARQQNFFHFIAILSTFHLLTLLTYENQLETLPKSHFKKEILLKVGTLFMIAIVGSLVDKYLNSKMGYLIALIFIKTLIDSIFYIPSWRQMKKNSQ
jgi:hypothetical protein